MDIVLVKAPTAAPVNLADLKKHVIASDFTDDDDILQMYLDAAVNHMDGYSGVLGRALMTQEWAVQACEWRACFTMPMKPVKGVALKYFDEANVERIVPDTSYRLSGETLWLDSSFTRPSLYARGDAISVVFTLGEDDPADVPAAIKAAILLMAAGLYANREQIGGQAYENPAFDLLISPYRRMHP
ncbi:phage conserved hypothetical protein, phiE125 gp8 family [Phyllobacterium sp. YR620]|uniref:head-tail connector protein n=1 Tax=Phyllobacterium sp. YR620 TaxID=1881066 RepID=UPI000890197D|nr:hypothetical protein [Phyllobacterium sp. YR620]SDP92471.1 phage conserved hypothetical protein, phiE125 gp8 family [Phyllobacterium sp. YR620]